MTEKTGGLGTTTFIPAKNNTNGHFFMDTNGFLRTLPVHNVKDALSNNISNYFTRRLWFIISGCLSRHPDNSVLLVLASSDWIIMKLNPGAVPRRNAT